MEFRDIESTAKNIGGERGIRTLEAFRLTHFPGVLLRPLGHLTVQTFGANSSLASYRIQARVLYAPYCLTVRAFFAA